MLFSGDISKFLVLSVALLRVYISTVTIRKFEFPKLPFYYAGLSRQSYRRYAVFHFTNRKIFND